MSENVRHTPGPWTHYDDSEDGKTNRHEIAALGKTVAHIYRSVPDEDRANAHLIAAAPDLLSALRDVIGWVPGPSCFATSEPRLAVERAIAAIAKATGATP